MVDLFKLERSAIFRGKSSGLFYPKFKPQRLETLLQAYLGDVSLSDALTPIVITAANQTQTPFESFLFDTCMARQDAGNDFLMRDVGRATSAAQTYFPEARIWNIPKMKSYKFSDGGLWRNNPAEIVYHKIMNNFEGANRKNIALLSIGTGKSKCGYNVPPRGGMIDWARPAIYGQMDMNASGVDQMMREALGNNYIRLQPQILDKRGNLKVANLADASSVLFEQYEDIASRVFCLYAVHDEDNFIRTLIEKRDQRKDPI